jgi:hypothetical protein
MKKILVVGIILLFLGSSMPVYAYSEWNSPNKNLVSNKVMIIQNPIISINNVQIINLSYGEVSIDFKKEKHGYSLVTDVSYFSSSPFFYLNTSTKEIKLRLALNYSCEMHYINGPYIEAPLIAIGFKIDNYTDFNWKFIKLKHNGYHVEKENLSISTVVNTTGCKPGDTVELHPYLGLIMDPYIGGNTITSLAYRLFFNFPYSALFQKLLTYYSQYNIDKDGVPITFIFSND